MIQVDFAVLKTNDASGCFVVVRCRRDVARYLEDKYSLARPRRTADQHKALGNKPTAEVTIQLIKARWNRFLSCQLARFDVHVEFDAHVEERARKFQARRQDETITHHLPRFLSGSQRSVQRITQGVKSLANLFFLYCASPIFGLQRFGKHQYFTNSFYRSPLVVALCFSLRCPFSHWTAAGR